MKSSSNKKDRISTLPEDLRCAILSFLSYKDAVATSVLSTTWRYGWLNLTSLVIDQHFHNSCNSYVKRSFDEIYVYDRGARVHPSSHRLNFLDDLLRRWMKENHHNNTKIPTLQLDLSPVNTKENEFYLLSFLKNLDINNLLLYVDEGNISYAFMKFLLTTVSLVDLTLRQVGDLPHTSLGTSFNPFSRLRKLSLHLVNINQEVIDALFGNGGTSIIECLTFDKCTGFNRLKLSELSRLKELHLSHNYDLTRVEIVRSPNLRFMCFKAHRGGVMILIDDAFIDGHGQHELMKSNNSDNRNQVFLQCSILKELEVHNCHVVKLAKSCMMDHLEILRVTRSCFRKIDINCDYGYLRQLNLADCVITDGLLNQHLSRLANLKVFKIERCCKLKHLQISLKHLQTFSIKRCVGLCIVEMDCPKLCNLKYRGNIAGNPLLCVLRGSIGAPDFFEIYVSKFEHSYYQDQFTKVLNKIKFGEENEEGNCFVPLCEVKHLKLIINDKFDISIFGECMEELLWLCPRLERIQFTPSMKTGFAKCNKPFNVIIRFKYKDDPAARNCGCYTSLDIGCWWHSIEDFVYEEKQVVEDEDAVLKLIKSLLTKFRSLESAMHSEVNVMHSCPMVPTVELKDQPRLTKP